MSDRKSSSSIFRIIQGIVNIVNSNGERIDSSDDLQDSSKKRIDANLGSETINSSGKTANRVIITQPTPEELPPPSNILLSSNEVTEDSSIGATVGIFTTENGLGAYVYSIVSDPDSKFQISGNELQLAAAVDFDIAEFHNVTIRVTDANSNTFDKSFVINVIEAAVAPSDKRVNLNGIDEAIFNNSIVELNGVANLAFTICFTVTRFREGVFEKVFSRQTTSSNKRGYEISFDTNDRLHFKIIDNITSNLLIDVRTNASQTINETRFYCITYDGSQVSGGVSIKRDDSNVSTSTLSNTLTFNRNIGSNQAYFGASSNLSDPLQGALNHIMLFSRVLTNSEISELWNGGSVLEDLTSFSAINANIIHVPIDDTDVYPTLTDKRGNYNLTMNVNMSQSNIVSAS
jgi:hypothetical protein